MEIIIDLLNNNRDKKNLGLEWNVSLKEPKKGLFQNFSFVRRHQHIEKILKLSIENLCMSKELICRRESLLSVVYAGKEYAQSDFPIEVEIEKERTPFQVFISQNAILDCSEPQQRIAKVYSITSDLILKDANDTIVDKRSLNVDVKFASLDIKPRFALALEKNKIQYNSLLRIYKIGELVTWTDEEYSYTPSVNIDVNLKLYCNNEIRNNILFFEDKSTQVVTIVKPSRKNLQRFSVYLDFSKISNPIQSEIKFTIESTIVQSMVYSPEVKQRSVELEGFSILKDQQGTELNVVVTNLLTNDSQIVTSSENHNIQTFNFVPSSRMMAQIAVDFNNIATDSSNPYAGLLIKNLTVSESVLDGVRILGENNLEINSFINISGDEHESFNSNEGLFIKNGENARATIYVSFDPSRIKDIIPTNSGYQFQLESLISFDYWENKDGVAFSSLESKTFKLPLIWNLFLEPNPEWLCVDYGSSAIVCKYHNNLIDLNTQKDKIFRKAFPGFKEDEYEIGTKFLSSDIVLHSVEGVEQSSICSELDQSQNILYDKLSICLSPTSSLIINDVQRQVPCLKILVGNEFLPEKADYMTFQFPRKSVNGMIERVEAKKTKDEDSSILRISTIFKEAYSALFRYFIQPVSGESRKLNKLVLTYPNTYTPAHLKVLRSIANITFPHLRDGYLKFVSESDAVAAYYIDHWSEFNPNKKISDKENVLVYDMGAGTLDVTLLEKLVNENGRLEVNIKGKLGTGKAGNYLDFIIAEIVNELLSNKETKLVSTQQALNVQMMKDRLNMKNAIRSHIKPNLIEGKILTYNHKQISASEIISHVKFQNVLKEVTNEIVKQLCSYMGEERLSIDTIIMSGRSCKLQLLKDALIENVSAMSIGKNHFIDFSENNQNDREKTVVVEGAIAQAGKFNSKESQVVIKSKRLYASYGIIYQMLGGEYKYIELLNHNDVPYSDSNSMFESKNVLIEGTSSAQAIYLIQTYLSPEETEKCYNAKDFEFISEMEEYDMADFGNVNTLNVKLRLDLNNNISIFINGKISKGSSPKGVDLSSEITKRSIWPVTI